MRSDGTVGFEAFGFRGSGSVRLGSICDEARVRIHILKQTLKGGK